MRIIKNSEYNKLDEAIKCYENHKYPSHRICWITDRICWAWKFKKITDLQKNELCHRIIAVMDSEPDCY